MFLVIEGIDGAGCETQAKAVYNLLSRKLVNKPITFIKYPHYDTPVGKMIQKFLYQNKDLSAEQQFLLYSLQFIYDSQLIKKNRQKGIIIADRYFSSTLCFQTLEGVDLKVALKFAEDFKIEKPELVFYLNVRPDIAIVRKFGENKVKNRREKDFDFIKKTYKQYRYLVNNQVWTKWININGERKAEEITKDIFNKLKTQILNLKCPSKNQQI